jgi:hypothetical protein
MFGEKYYLVNNLVNECKCSPLEYLIRMHLWEKLFRSSPTALGITNAGSIVSIQPFIQGHEPAQDTVDKFLFESGLVEVKRKCWLWKRAYKGLEVWIGDARRDNFVETDQGIVPIDIRVWFIRLPGSDVEL